MNTFLQAYRQKFVKNVIKKVVLPLRTYSVTQTEKKEKWDIMCGVCLERKPVISRPLNKIEEDFQNMLYELENENSMKSEHEVRHEVDIRRAAEFKKGLISTKDVDKSLGETATEFEDNSTKEFTEFKLASRITEADKKNDQKAINRKLDGHLLFIINIDIEGQNLWVLPFDRVQENESLRETAERIIHEKCGSKIVAKFYGNAPCGFHKYKYSAEIRQKSDIIGAKTFFMKAEYIKGNIEENNNRFDYYWATRNEISERFKNSYYRSISSFLIEDEEPEMN